MTDGLGWEENLIAMGLDRRDAQGRLAPVYHLPLTKKMYETLTAVSYTHLDVYKRQGYGNLLTLIVSPRA